MSDEGNSIKRAQARARKTAERKRLADAGIKQLVILAPVGLHDRIKIEAQRIISAHPADTKTPQSGS